MAAEKIIEDWKKKIFKPIYWLEGEEPFFIDVIVQYAEHHLLTEEEAAFNRTIFYGKDAQWPDVLNACMRYPVFAEKQLVLIKEAQYMKDILKLENYLEKPLASTILVVAYKEKKIDQRTKFSKLLKDKAVLLSTKKIYDDKLPEWTRQLIMSKGMTIQQDALFLLIDHIGNDLSRIQQEIEKMAISIGERKQIQVTDIEMYIGISKQYNIFELQSAIATKDLAKCLRIIQYFGDNPDAVSIPQLLATIYGFFSKVYMLFEMQQVNLQTVLPFFNRHPVSSKQAIMAYELYGYAGIEKILLLLHQYNLRSIGLHDAGNGIESLLKEMVVKMTRC